MQHRRPQSHHKPRAYLHIGPHKTGSTYVQEMLCNKTQELAGANLVLPISESCRTRCQSHFVGVAGQLLLEEGTGNPEVESYARFLMQHYGCSSDPVQELKRDLHAAKDSDVVISAEDFVRIGDRGVAALADLLSGYETYVVIMYRQKLPHLVSLYFQLQRKNFENIRTKRQSFDAFYWQRFSGVDPASTTPTHTQVSGLFLSKLVHVYGKYFGMDRFIVVNYENVGNDLWNTFATDVLQAPTARVDVAPGRVNTSPDPFVFAVVVHYYRARWGGDTSPAKLPSMQCTLPLLAEVAASLPRRCTSFDNVVRPWEREEGRILEDLAASGSRLIMFDGDLLGRYQVSKASKPVCDVDFEAVQRIAGHKMCSDEAFLTLMKEASDRIDATCA